MQEAELVRLATTLGDLILRGIGPRSGFALKVALEAASVDGITGILALKIPARTNQHVDCMFAAGAVDVHTDWGDVA